MKIGLRILALIFALCVVLAWVGLGANRGFTKTAIAIKKTDPVTEIEFTEYQKGIVPGVDFLAAGLIGSGVFFALSFLPFKPKTKTP